MIDNLRLTVDALAGASIHQVCREATELATRLVMPVQVVFNGICLLARPGDDWHDLVLSWDHALETGRNFASVNQPGKKGK